MSEITTDATSDGEEETPCPRCGEDINAGQNENYCDNCGRWVCPICLTLCGFEDDDPVCVHYVIEQCDIWGDDHFEGYYDQKGRDPEFVELLNWPEATDEDTLAKIDQLTPEARNERLGAFAVLYAEDPSVQPFEDVATRLPIPLQRAYNNEFDFTIMHFSSLGGDEVWKRLSEARRTFEAGIAALA